MPRGQLRFTPNRLPIVGVSFRTERLFALIDTGSQISLISPKVAASFSLPITGQTVIVGVTGEVKLVSKTTLDDLRVAGIPWEPLAAAIADFTRLGKKIDTILGVDAFRNKKLQIHFNEGRTYL